MKGLIVEAPRMRRTAYRSGRREMAGLTTPMTPLQALTGRKTKRRITAAGKKKNNNPLARTPLRSPHRWKER